MNKLYSIILLTVIISCASWSVSKAADMKVTADKVTGSVEVQAPGAASWAPLSDGAIVPQGATIKTGVNSSAMLKWAAGNVAKIPALSRIKLDEVSRSNAGAEKSSLNIQQGKVFAHVKKLETSDSKFELKTPTAVAGVRGSDVFGTAGIEGSTFGVTDGAMAVTVGDQEVMLEPGLAVIVDSLGNLGDVIPIPEEIKQEAEQSAKETKAEAQKEEKTQTKSEKKQEKKSEAKKEEKKEEKTEARKEEKSESKSESKEESKTSSDGTSPSGSAGGGDSTDASSGTDAAPEPEVDLSQTATDNIDSVLEDSAINTIVEEAEELYKTGTVDVYIHVDQ